MRSTTWGRMRTFLAVFDTGSIRGAASQLQVSESAVSSAVTHLEGHLAVELFTKDGRGIRATDTAAVYAGYCRRILGLLDEAEASVLSAEQGRLRIGAVATASEYVLPGLLASYSRRFPDVELSLSVLPRDDLFRLLSQHDVDVVVAGRPTRGSGLVTRAQRANALIIVAAPGEVADPLRATWLLRGPGSGTRDTTLGLLTHLEASPHTLTLGTLGAVVAATKAGLGITLVHADAVDRDIEAGLLERRMLAGTPLNRPWHMVTTEASTRSASLFLSHVTDRDQVGDAAFHLRDRPAG